MPKEVIKTPFRDHFSNVSDQYAQFRPRYPDALFGYLAERSPQREVAWDCATGTGQAALPLARLFSRVIAADASARQTTQAEKHPRVHYIVAAAEASGLRASSIDLITVAQALHWFDLPRFYAEVERVLRPGGVLAVWSYGRLRMAPPALQSCLDHFYDDIVGPYWPPERRHVEEGYRSLAFPFDELRPPAFALTADWPLNHLAGYLRTWSATQAYTRAHGHDPVANLLPELAKHWGHAHSQCTVTWPIALRVGLRP
ncbi:MAG: class I SAM-dependent methyltransferase [Desulfatitalea sp.]|nr:class I SAM-dependent methyltransferase [Desulfatitalea sp.]MBI5894690.1 class I SAM-dependent methyltransferase [Desulfobacterales bacterium]